MPGAASWRACDLETLLRQLQSRVESKSYRPQACSSPRFAEIVAATKQKVALEQQQTDQAVEKKKLANK